MTVIRRWQGVPVGMSEAMSKKKLVITRAKPEVIHTV